MQLLFRNWLLTLLQILVEDCYSRRFHLIPSVIPSRKSGITLAEMRPPIKPCIIWVALQWDELAKVIEHIFPVKNCNFAPLAREVMTHSTCPSESSINSAHVHVTPDKGLLLSRS